MRLAQQLKRVDFYRHVPVDLTEPTAPGAIISIACFVLMISLFFGEVVSFISPKVRSDMFVAQDEGHGAKLRVNFNMTFHKLPCFALSLDVLDVLGRHEVGMSGTVHKTRISVTGENLGEFSDNSHDAMVQSKMEGCNIEGHVMVNKVPGNFHVSAHGLQHLVQRYLDHANIEVPHTIHTLWFGEQLGHVGNQGFEGQVHSLDGTEHRQSGNMHYEYFIDIVPTVYEGKASPQERKRGAGVARGYQYTATMHMQELDPGHMSAAFFRYQLSPITVKFAPERTSFLHFLTYVCAIIGGVFTVAGILTRSIHTTVTQLQKRALGKAS